MGAEQSMESTSTFGSLYTGVEGWILPSSMSIDDSYVILELSGIGCESGKQENFQGSFQTNNNFEASTSRVQNEASTSGEQNKASTSRVQNDSSINHVTKKQEITRRNNTDSRRPGQRKNDKLEKKRAIVYQLEEEGRKLQKEDEEIKQNLATLQSFYFQQISSGKITYNAS